MCVYERRTDYRTLGLKAFIPSGQNTALGADILDQFYHVLQIIKRASDVRLGAMNYSVTNNGISKGLQYLDLIWRENSNEISGKNKRLRSKTPKTAQEYGPSIIND